MQDKSKLDDPSRNMIRAERLRLMPGDEPVPGKEEHIGAILKKLFKSIDKGEEDLKTAMLSEWQALAGSVAAESTRPGRLVNGVLIVFVKNSVWLSEISRYELKGMQQRITARFGRDKIKKIRLTIG
ncbi:MAG: DUF721 domain-containing protein [Lentisphaerae bacterium]|nr:DUF721 domain-containing protein [Lentisphaerota bacterium]